MKTEYTLGSAHELTPELIESIKLAFADRPIKITIQDLNPNASSKSKNGKIPKDLTDTVIDVIFDQLSKKKKK